MRPPRAITLADIQVYERYGGDLDGYVRSGRAGDVPDATWYAIDALRTRLTLVTRGLGSPGFAQELAGDLDAWTADDVARLALRSLAEADSKAVRDELPVIR